MHCFVECAAPERECERALCVSSVCRPVSSGVKRLEGKYYVSHFRQAHCFPVVLNVKTKISSVCQLLRHSIGQQMPLLMFWRV